MIGNNIKNKIVCFNEDIIGAKVKKLGKTVLGSSCTEYVLCTLKTINGR
jgi:hypothetical protein